MKITKKILLILLILCIICNSMPIYALENLVSSVTKETKLNEDENSSTNEVVISSTNEGEKPITDEVEKSITDETKEPTTDEVEKPTIDETKEPTTDEAEKPTIDEAKEPITDEVEKSTTDETEKPTTDEAEKPATDETEKPITDEVEKPTTDKLKDSTTNEAESLTENEVLKGEAETNPENNAENPFTSEHPLRSSNLKNLQTSLPLRSMSNKRSSFISTLSSDTKPVGWDNALHFIVRHWHSAQIVMNEDHEEIENGQNFVIIEGYIVPQETGYEFYIVDQDSRNSNENRSFF